MDRLIDNELQQKAKIVLEKLKDYSANYQRVTHQHGLSCPESCGNCCLSPQVEASPVEFLPLALILYQQGNLENMMEELKEYMDKESTICFFYRDKQRKHCSIYPYRGFICRAFGVFKRNNRLVQEEISICPEIGIDKNNIKNIELPNMANWKRMFDSYFNLRETQMMPINKAIDECFETVFLKTRNR